MPRKKRVMTEEQRQAAIERLAKAREKRLKNNPPEYKNVANTVLALPEDADLSMKNVKQWIKTQRGLAAAERQNMRAGIKGAQAKLLAINGYVNNMETYLKTGDWIDSFWGEYAENKMGWICTHMAYDDEGYPKRSVGVFYKDLGMTWTQEMDVAERSRNG